MNSKYKNINYYYKRVRQILKFNKYNINSTISMNNCLTHSKI